jgi:carboxymethylenebutenolidase
MGKRFVITTNKGDLEGYLAEPKAGNGAGVLVLHAWWGLTDGFKGVCDRLAEEGFTALAPDLYHGASGVTIAEATALSRALDEKRANREIKAAFKALLGQPGVTKRGAGVMGFSMGAWFAGWIARNMPKAVQAVVLFYGTAGGKYDVAQAAFQGHFAASDPYEDPKDAAAMAAHLREVGREVSFFTYPGTGHWFFEPDRPEAYNEEAARLAWRRTVEFLKKQLV